jgi:hypothetical protein
VATQKTSPLDATGKAAEDAAKRNAKEMAARKDELTTMRQEEEILLSTAVFDPKKPDQPLLIDEIEEVGVAVNNDKVVIRTITDIDDMTYGVGNTFTFKAGVKYSVTRDLADYLEGLGYIWRPN